MLGCKCIYLPHPSAHSPNVLKRFHGQHAKHANKSIYVIDVCKAWCISIAWSRCKGSVPLRVRDEQGNAGGAQPWPLEPGATPEINLMLLMLWCMHGVKQWSHVNMLECKL